MAALWSIGSTGIYVDGLSRRKDSTWAEIDVISATTTVQHWYGSRSLEFRVRGHLWGLGNIEDLESYHDQSDAQTFAGPNGFSKQVILKNVDSRRIPDKTDTSNEFYQVELELAEES